MCIYIYIYRERDIERKKRETGFHSLGYSCIYLSPNCLRKNPNLILSLYRSRSEDGVTPFFPSV